jgi:hypothetical protein
MAKVKEKKRTKNDLQSTTQKIKDLETKTPQTMEISAVAPE